MLLASCSEDFNTETRSQDKTGSTTQSGWGYDDLYDNSYNEADSTWIEDGQTSAYVDEFLSAQLGSLEMGDLTDGSNVVAGPGYGPSVVLSCAEGALYVAAGAATGTLATIFAASGVAVGGGGVAVTAPASVPMYAAAGGLIGLGLSTSSWATCIAPLAQVGLGLIQHGYLSAARGLQSIVFEMRRSSPSQSQSQSNSGECRQGSRKCGQMTGRYKNNYCNPLNEWRDWLNINVHTHGICDFGGLSCSEIREVAGLAAGCWRGRKAVTDRCFDGQADPGHRKASQYAERDFDSCIDLSFRTGCQDYSIEDELDRQAQNAFPECL